MGSPGRYNRAGYCRVAKKKQKPGFVAALIKSNKKFVIDMQQSATFDWFLNKVRILKNNRAIVSNFSSLFSLQIANYVFPLLTFPYLVRVLGPGNYGLIAFAQAFISFFILVTEYGFGFSGVRAVATIKDDSKAVSEIFSSVIIIKIGLSLLGFIVLCMLVSIVPRFRTDWPVYLLTFGMVLENVLFPTWLFQGMQDMKAISIRSIAAKAVYTACIFLLVTESSDYLLVPIIYSISAITSGTIGLFYSLKHFKIRFRMPSKHTIKRDLKDGWTFFYSSIAIRICTATNTVVLGFFASNAVVGLYSAAERLIRVLTELGRPLFQAIYPHINVVVTRSREEAIAFLRPLFRVVFAASFVVFLCVLFFSDHIVDIVLGAKYENAITIFMILTPLLVFVPVSHVFANLTLAPFRLDSSFLRIYTYGTIINFIMLSVFVGLLDMQASGSALATTIVEGSMTFIMFRILKAKKILLWK
jgi:PST family polysaccharide transporter